MRITVVLTRAVMQVLGDRFMRREFLKPRLAATVRVVKRSRPDTFVFYHSDGNIEPIIPDLIEIGLARGND